ncbi:MULTISPECIES: hypothetical protein [Olivibacter]|uniref:Uncharacterized protein n=2 Tax=Olivibacter TaxID=376469 RepID=A0ABV6HQQ4_9SPHI|nr:MULTISPECIES: hypothetical protein [Olivibacter]MCL4640240.1 hypothetical protein [Olivibacter sp. UJ_SKK_5.1]MDM8174037.1 hypothetical protein [Olivibacter sp. 47]MDX3916881.1 hypothetical protein [Pseudosphingobacterium sp.]QEL03823.1 hypothetical protein FKG96_24325 [Olivibacter sp. LS-1]
MSYFWKAYMFFFAVPFPMILYYSINYNSEIRGDGTNPWLALTYLLISLVLWTIVLYKLYQRWIALTLQTKSNIESLLRDGVLKDGEIVDVKTLKPVAKDVETLEVSVRFENFSGTKVLQTIPINDSKPQQNRYEAGKRIKLRIDKTLKSSPVFIPDGVQVELRKSQMFLSIIGWLLALGLVIAYYIFSYQLESRGTGWRFLIFWHPLLLCPLILLLSFLGLDALLGQLSGLPKDVLRLIFYGKQATARILSAKQTGTYINEQPQVRFELDFKDERGRTHRVSLKKIVSLLEVSITQQQTVDIFYLEEDPQTIAFSKDLND